MQTKAQVDKLILDHKKLIESEASKYASNLPLITMQIEAYKLAHEAARDYDSAIGIKFSTFLVNRLKKLSRLSTQYGSTIRLPENTQFGINKLNKLEKDLEDKYGRSPTIEELSDHSGFNIKTVSNLLKNKKNVVTFSKLLNAPTLFDSQNDEWVSFVYHDLPPRDKLIFEHKTGFGGKAILSNEDIAKKLEVTPNVLNTRIKLMSDMLSKGWK